jgi:hypothetical protein
MPSWSAGSLLEGVRALLKTAAQQAADASPRFELPPALEEVSGYGPVSRAVAPLLYVPDLRDALLDLLRAHLPCPTLEKLRVAFGSC